ncbi:MAG: bifunctional UDP-N-acetylglucosamine diphosphorylase/glucosamine-1-phosphate N-acetyltransferase GlmU [Chloroflexi bacterium]|nr:bifunctional UDP-N-acetylglucosamine diphosphorylase/glucosamine-1-phosphate N-acetyltransferase GlmU [Chloroflexota bacterium]
MTLASIILAAGAGTRMRSKLPKVLHPLAGKPLIWFALNAVLGLVDQPPLIVVGHGADVVKAVVGDVATFAFQAEQLGTGHAVMMAQPFLEAKADRLLVTFADMPLLREDSLKQLIDLHAASHSPVTMTSFIGEEARGFGRVIRDEKGHVVAIVEQADATPEQLAICEYNVSAYCFDAQWLWSALAKIPVSPKGEYYLTDVVGLAVAEGFPVEALVLDDPDEAIGLNNRLHLAEAEKVMRKRINEAWMLAGVTVLDPERTYIEVGVQIGVDTVILPNTYLRGETVIGEDCQIGPDTTIIDSKVGNHAHLLSSVLEQAEVHDHVTLGPYCHLRKGAILDEGVHLGNFGEVKQAYLGPGTKVGHFSYIGDAKIGKNVNIGAGTVTCNFDGANKNLTEIGDEVFIGSDTMLVAPVKIGARSITGAGSVVTHDVPEDTLVMGVPAKVVRKLEKSDP